MSSESNDPLAELVDVDEIVMAHIAEQTAHFRLVASSDDRMLKWEQPVEIQAIPGTGFHRIGIVGDGNCMIHAFMFATSPAYRGLLGEARGNMADRFREALVANHDVLEHDAGVIYAKQGGAVVVEEALTSLPTRREELSVEFGPVLGRLYSINFLAVQYREGEGLVPIAVTKWGFKEDQPTVLVNYLGGGVNAGDAAGFMAGGHYEVMIAGEVEEGEDGHVALADDATYLFPPGHELITALMGTFPKVDSSEASSSVSLSSSAAPSSSPAAEEIDPATAALLESEGLGAAEAPPAGVDQLNYFF